MSRSSEEFENGCISMHRARVANTGDLTFLVF